MRRWLRPLAWTAGGLLAVAAIVGGLWGLGGHLLFRYGAAADGPLEVWTQPAVRGELVETVSAPGEVEAITSVELSARVSARIRRLPFQEGDAVAAGDLLVELDATDLAAQLEAARQRRAGLVASLAVEQARIRGLEAGLESARAGLVDAEQERDRQAELAAAGDVSSRAREQAEMAAMSAGAGLAAEEATLEAARLNLEVTRFSIASAEADIRRFEDNLADTTMRSPIHGVVTRLNVEVGELAVTGTMNNPGTVLLEVADLSGLDVVARVDEADVARVSVGQPAEVRLPAFPGDVFAGVVQRVALSTPDSGSGSSGLGATPSYETRVRLSELPDPVRTGLSATVEIEAARFEDVVLVPNQSIFSVPLESVPEAVRDAVPQKPYTVGGQRTALVVYVVEDGELRLTPVEIGASDAKNTVVVAGLEDDAPVVTGPFAAFESLEDALAVSATATATETETVLDGGGP